MSVDCSVVTGSSAIRFLPHATSRFLMTCGTSQTSVLGRQRKNARYSKRLFCAAEPRQTVAVRSDIATRRTGVSTSNRAW